MIEARSICDQCILQSSQLLCREAAGACLARCLCVTFCCHIYSLLPLLVFAGHCFGWTTTLVTMFAVYLLCSLRIIALVAYFPDSAASPFHPSLELGHGRYCFRQVFPLKFLQCDKEGWWLLEGLVPAHSVAREPPSAALYFHKAPNKHSWHQFPSSPAIDEFNLNIILTGTKNFLISSIASPNLAWACPGGASTSISTWRSSSRWAYFGSPEARNSSSWGVSNNDRKCLEVPRVSLFFFQAKN